MKQQPKLITFDCYGTLIDWDREARNALDKLVSKNRWEYLKVFDLYKEWEEIEFKMIQGQYPESKPYREYKYKPYKDILVESIREVLKKHQLPEKGNEMIFADSIKRWRPFNDVKPVLEELRKYAKIGILSNIDNDIIQESIKLIEIKFDIIVTSEDVRRYKPRIRHFCEMLDRTGLWNFEVLHVAFGFKYDIEPAKRLGIPCVWVQRGSPFVGKQEKDGHVIKPNFVVQDLFGVLGIIKELKN